MSCSIQIDNHGIGSAQSAAKVRQAVGSESLRACLMATVLGPGTGMP